MNWKTPGIVVAVLAVGALTSMVALAQEQESIIDVLNIAGQDEIVSVSGSVTDGDEENNFILDDGTGQIDVDLGPPWWNTFSLNVDEAVTVTGEVGMGRDGDEPKEIDAIRVTRGDGSILEVRPEGGRPPWAGGPAVVGEKHPGYAGWSNSQNTP